MESPEEGASCDCVFSGSVVKVGGVGFAIDWSEIIAPHLDVSNEPDVI